MHDPELLDTDSDIVATVVLAQVLNLYSGLFLKFAEQYKLLLWQRQKRFTTHEYMPEVSIDDTISILNIIDIECWILDILILNITNIGY